MSFSKRFHNPSSRWEFKVCLSGSVVQVRRLEAQRGKKPAKSLRERVEGPNEDPDSPTPHWHALQLTISLGGRSLPGAHVNGAQLGGELARGAQRGGSLSQRTNRRCISLGLMVIKCRHRSPASHCHLLLLFRTPSPFLCLYLLWRWLKTHPRLPAGPEAEVTSLSL